MAAKKDEAQRELPDEVVEDIVLFRLDAFADVALFAGACRSYRRVVCNSEFLRRFRSLRPPPVVGAFVTDEPPVLQGGNGGDGGRRGSSYFHRAQPPRPSAPAALGVDRAADFTFSFLPVDPAAGPWRIRDVRDGRVLLSRRFAGAFDDLVVCDPLHRRSVLIPPVPGDLLDAPHQYGALELEVFLAPAGDDGDEGSPPLRVIANALCAFKMETAVFSSATGEWSHATSRSFSTCAYARVKDLDAFVRHYAHGCFYWTHYNRRIIFELDVDKMEFSVLDRPQELNGRRRGRSLAVVDAGEDDGPILIAVVGTRLDLYFPEGLPWDRWQYENKWIPLPQGYYWYIMAASEGILLLQAVRRSQSEEVSDSEYFTMDVKTWRLEKLCTTDHSIVLNHIYANYPPPLSPPSISDGLLASQIDFGINQCKGRREIHVWQSLPDSDVIMRC